MQTEGLSTTFKTVALKTFYQKKARKVSIFPLISFSQSK
jgi:hypothetical protein